MSGLLTALGQIWRLATPYFKSEEKWFARSILLIVLAIDLFQVFMAVQLNSWNLRFFNALQMKDIDAWLHELTIFFAIFLPFALAIPLNTYIISWLTIRWRRWMTDRYLSDWLRSNNHYRMQLKGSTDNPDQRIAIDVQLFIADSLALGLGLVGAVTSLASFIVVLWGISARTPLPILGQDYSFPGYLVFAALFSAIVGTTLTHLVGRQLVGLNFNQQRYEADFRFSLVRVRENSEQIALLGGAPVEQKNLMTTFVDVVRNFRAIMNRTLKMGLFSAGWGQVSGLVPSFLIAPSYLMGQSMLGTLMQTSGAFISVSIGFNFFMTNYGRLTGWKAVIDRLVGFEAATAEAEREAAREGTPRIHASSGKGLEVEDLAVQLPDRRPLVSPSCFGVDPGERVLVTGTSGTGKSTLFRALGGIWPFGSGNIRVPEGARVMIVPQKPYLPIGTLAASITYPSPATAWSREEIADVLKEVGLPGLAARLDEQGHWMLMLSLGEQQRIAIARVLLHRPDYLFLDESTASLDEESEAALYGLLHARLPETTIVSIGHRSSLKAFHQRRFTLKREGEASSFGEVTMDGGALAGARA